MPLTRIRELRKANGLTLLELADVIGTTPQTIQRLETDNMSVNIGWLFKLAEAMEFNPRDLLSVPPDESEFERFVRKVKESRIRFIAGSEGRKFVPTMVVEASNRLILDILSPTSKERRKQLFVELCTVASLVAEERN